MKTLPNEIQEYHDYSAQIAYMETRLKSIENDIVTKYCPFKVGDKIVYKCHFKSKTTEDYGIVYSIRFKGVNASAIDNKWLIHIKRTKKNFEPIKNNIDHIWDKVGEHEKDTINHFNK